MSDWAPQQSLQKGDNGYDFFVCVSLAPHFAWLTDANSAKDSVVLGAGRSQTYAGEGAISPPYPGTLLLGRCVERCLVVTDFGKTPRPPSPHEAIEVLQSELSVDGLEFELDHTPTEVVAVEDNEGNLLGPYQVELVNDGTGSHPIFKVRLTSQRTNPLLLTTSEWAEFKRFSSGKVFNRTYEVTWGQVHPGSAEAEKVKVRLCVVLGGILAIEYFSVVRRASDFHEMLSEGKRQIESLTAEFRRSIEHNKPRVTVAQKLTGQLGPGGRLDFVDESSFYRFFEYVVHRCGFSYAPSVLQSYHVNWKCGDLILLAGNPGTGKSSLPRLYALALSGKQPSRLERTERLLSVVIRPTVLDYRDLLGHFNVLSGVFNPGESGLFHHLVRSQREFEQHNENTGLFTVVLDEMNMAPIENYFNPFLQIVGSGEVEGERVVPVFSESYRVEDRDDVRHYSQISLPQSVRFVGSYNNDSLSILPPSRVLDRGAEILIARQSPSSANTPCLETQMSSSQISLAHLTLWNKSEALFSPEAASRVDRFQGSLAELTGVPISSRRTLGIEKFVKRRFPIDQEVDAVDLAISQRCLPFLRQRLRVGLPVARVTEVSKILNAIFEREMTYSQAVLQDIMNDTAMILQVR